MKSFSRLLLIAFAPFRQHNFRHVRKLTQSSDHIAAYLRVISVSAPAFRRHPDKYSDAFFEKEFEKAKDVMDPDLSDPTKIFRKMEEDQVRRERATQYNRVARLFPHAKEDRKLIHDTMDQIRFLKQEQPEEWTVKRLAASFDVSERTIIKVLKSKFVPSKEKKRNQDAVANKNMGLETPEPFVDNAINDTTKDLVRSSSNPQDGSKEPVKLQIARHVKFANQVDVINRLRDQSQLSHHRKWKEVADNSHQRKRKEVADNFHQKKKSPASTANQHHQNMGINDDKKQKTIETEAHSKSAKTFKPKPKYTNQMDKHTNQIDKDKFGKGSEDLQFDDDDSNIPPDWVQDDECKPMQVVQKGREFFDENGELLFRV